MLLASTSMGWTSSGTQGSPRPNSHHVIVRDVDHVQLPQVEAIVNARADAPRLEGLAQRPSW